MTALKYAKTVQILKTTIFMSNFLMQTPDYKIDNELLTWIQHTAEKRSKYYNEDSNFLAVVKSRINMALKAKESTQKNVLIRVSLTSPTTGKCYPTALVKIVLTDRGYIAKLAGIASTENKIFSSPLGEYVPQQEPDKQLKLL